MRTDSRKARPIAATVAATTCALGLGTLALAACGNGSDSNAADFDDAAARSMLFLTAEELGAKNTDVIEESALEAEVNGLSSLYANEPESDDADEDETASKCVLENLPFKVQIEGDKLSIVGEAKPFECKTKDGDSFKYTSFRLAFLAQCTELTEAAKALEGKLFGELPASFDPCKFGEEGRFISQIKSSFELGEGAENNISWKVLSSSSSADGGPCVHKDKVVNGCVKTDIENIASTTVGKATTTLKKTILTNQETKRSASATQKFFDGGTMAIVLGDWTGSAKYTAADAAPLWTLKRGSESKKGTFGKETVADASKSSLNLRAANAGREISRMVRTKLLPQFN